MRRPAASGIGRGKAVFVRLRTGRCDGRDRADRNAGAAIDANIGVDPKGLLAFGNARNGADRRARGILYANAGFADDMRDFPHSDLDLGTNWYHLSCQAFKADYGIRSLPHPREDTGIGRAARRAHGAHVVFGSAMAV